MNYISEDGVDYYHFSVPLLPKLVDEHVHVSLCRNGDGAESQSGSRTLDYTMREYLERAKDTEKTAALAKAIANYADRAKVYFGYSGDSQGSADNEGFAGSLEDIKPVNVLDLAEYAAKIDEMPAGYAYKVLTGGSSNEKLVELIKAMYWYRVESEGYCKE